jgi:hypothetical protein
MRIVPEWLQDSNIGKRGFDPALIQMKYESSLKIQNPQSKFANQPAICDLLDLILVCH